LKDRGYKTPCKTLTLVSAGAPNAPRRHDTRLFGKKEGLLGGCVAPLRLLRR
jgi:hypothetical protein